MRIGAHRSASERNQSNSAYIDTKANERLFESGKTELEVDT